MAYDKFTVLTSSAVPLPIENVDTDQIIPARFLKATKREGFGDNLFRDWRYNSDNTPKADFVLNNPTYSGKILVAGRNFGSGSSREHAAWAIYDYGFRCVISSFFADIFKGNSLKNSLLPIVVPAGVHADLFAMVAKDPGVKVKVDLAAQKLILPDGRAVEFPVDEFSKHCLLDGIDELGYILKNEGAIAAFEARREGSINTLQ